MYSTVYTTQQRIGPSTLASSTKSLKLILSSGLPFPIRNSEI